MSTELSPTNQFQLQDLLYLMQRLRDPSTGCPWDIKQTFDSITPCTLEEAYEVVDTIAQHDYVHLKEELGDLLFQIVFYCQLAAEETLFDFNTVVSALVTKLVTRHPHVFPEGALFDQRCEKNDQVDENNIKKAWEALKKQERHQKGQTSTLADIPIALPALSRAQKLQKRAASQGFDWPSLAGVMDKINEERAELDQAIQANDRENIEEELGDLMFSMVNLCRHLKVDSETALRQANHKFERRFQYIESFAQANNQSLTKMSMEQLNQLWNEAKAKQV